MNKSIKEEIIAINFGFQHCQTTIAKINAGKHCAYIESYIGDFYENKK